MTRRLRIATVAIAIVPLWVSSPALVGLVGQESSDAAKQQPTDSSERKATNEKRFDMLHKSVVDLSDDYEDDVLRTIGFLLLAIGWILTSEKSREFLKQNRSARRAALATIPMIALVHVGWSIGTFRISQNKMALLIDLHYIDAKFYADDGITWFFFATNLTVHVALFVVLFALVYSLSRTPVSEKA